MTDEAGAGARSSPRGWSTLWRWVGLVALSLALAGLLQLIKLPAALLLGPMLAAIVVAARGLAVRVPGSAFLLAQGALGVMIASHLPAEFLSELGARWPLFLLGAASTLGASTTLGWMLTRTGKFPGSTAIWGTSPGAATAMIVMSEAYGADARLVAVMQYVRVVCCAVVAAVMARLLGVPLVEVVASGTGVAQAMGAGHIMAGLTLVGAGSWLGVKLRLPAGALLLPMVIAIALKLSGVLAIVLPAPVLVLAYAMIGWGIGIRFTPQVLKHAARALPRVIVAILALLASCGLFAAALVYGLGVDPLTAYLATSPGGADSVSIIAASTQVDVPFVITMQLARFFAVLLFGPALARALSPAVARAGRVIRGAVAPCLGARAWRGRA